MFGNAGVADEDGDMTWDDWHLPVFEVVLTSEASASADSIFACCDEGWTPDSSVTVQIFDEPGGTSLFGPASVPTDLAGDFQVDAQTHGVDLVPGMQVMVTDDTTSIAKDLTLAEMSFDILDPDSDTASGTAPPEADVWVDVIVPGTESGFNVSVVADGSGNWFADFGAEGLDVTADMGGTAIVDDGDGDSTRAGIMPTWPCPSPTIEKSGVKKGKTCEISWDALDRYNITVGSKTRLFFNAGWGWASDPSMTDPSNYEEEFVSGGHTFTMLLDGEALAYGTLIEVSPNVCGPRGDTGEEQCADATYARWQYLSKRLGPGVHTISFELVLLKDFPDDGWGYSVLSGDVFSVSNTILVVRE
jgi:hypothetical protein